MCNNKRKTLALKLAFAMCFVSLIASMIHSPIYATEANSGENEKPSIANEISKEEKTISNDAVMQIRIGYEFEDGSFDQWAIGTGFLIDNKYILTTQTLADTTTGSLLYQKILKEKSKAYNKVGVSLSDELKTQKQIKIHIVNAKGEEKTPVNITAKNGIGVLHLGAAESSDIAIFTDVDKINADTGEKVKIKYTGKDSTKNEVQEAEGIIGEKEEGQESDTISIETNTSNGKPLGSPIMDKKGNVIGMTLGVNQSLSVVLGKTLQEALTANGIPYKTATTLEKEKQQDENAQKNNKTMQESLDKLKGIISEVESIDKNGYTEDSYVKLEEAITTGKKLLEEKEKTQPQIEAAISKIEKAKDELESVNILSKILKYATIMNVSILTGAIAILIAVPITIKSIKKVKKKGNKKQSKKEQDSDEINSEYLHQKEIEDLQNQGIDVTTKVAPASARTSRQAARDLHFADDAIREDDRVVDLSKDKFKTERDNIIDTDTGSNTTTLLSNTPYLIRLDNGEQIPIFDNFVIGKEKSRVDYRIAGNDSVSRIHVRFGKREQEYFVEDLNSKNYTYVDKKQIPRNSAVYLKNKSIICVSNVEFEFYTGSEESE